MKKKNYIEPKMEAMVIAGERIMLEGSSTNIEPNFAPRRKDGKTAVF